MSTNQIIKTSELKIVFLPIEVAKKVIEVYHYSKKMPANVMFCFGLVKENKVIGCCVFSKGGNYKTNKIGEYNCIELSRLVILGKNRRNLGSFFISRCLKLLPKPTVVLSYADTKQNHLGYIYQASNWIYSGISEPDKEYFIEGKWTHRKTVYDRYGSSDKSKLRHLNIIARPTGAKHRYFYCLGTKKQIKEMISMIKQQFGIFPYPKKQTKH